MGKCDHCGREVMKLLDHPFTDEQVCLKCMTRSGFHPPDVAIESSPREKRTKIRMPITIVMSFQVFDEVQQIQVSYPAFSVNLTTGGICFAWENCKHCLGFEEGSIHKNCIFRPYYLHNDGKKELFLNLKLTPTYTLEIPCYIVYVIQEKEMDIEYVGAKFQEVRPEQQTMLETIIMKYGRLYR